MQSIHYDPQPPPQVVDWHYIVFGEFPDMAPIGRYGFPGTATETLFVCTVRKESGTGGTPVKPDERRFGTCANIHE